MRTDLLKPECCNYYSWLSGNEMMHSYQLCLRNLQEMQAIATISLQSKKVTTDVRLKVPRCCPLQRVSLRHLEVH